MTIQTIGSASVALYLTPADLRERGLTPSGLTLERALEITRTAFQEAGILLDGSIEIEAYPDTCGVLVFAHVRPPERVWYSFETLDALLDAAHALPAPAPDAALSWWEGRWWIRSRSPTACRSSAARRRGRPIWTPSWPSTAASFSPRARWTPCAPISRSEPLTNVL